MIRKFVGGLALVVTALVGMLVLSGAELATAEDRTGPTPTTQVGPRANAERAARGPAGCSATSRRCRSAAPRCWRGSRRSNRSSRKATQRWRRASARR